MLCDSISSFLTTEIRIIKQNNSVKSQTSGLFHIVLVLMVSASCGHQMLRRPELWRCNTERICKHKHSHVLTEIKAEEDIQIRHLYGKQMILIFVLINVRSSSKDLQRTRVFTILCLIIGVRTWIYSLESRKLGKSCYHLCRDTYNYEDKNTQKRRARCQKNLFSNHISICFIDKSCKNHIMPPSQKLSK